MLTTFIFNIKAKETDRQTIKENQVRDVYEIKIKRNHNSNKVEKSAK